MAHEIKNPLTPIQLSAERIAKHCRGQWSKVSSQLSSQQFTEIDRTATVIKDGTDTILREVSSLKSMVDEFSRYARLPNVRLEEGDVNEIVKQATFLYEDRNDEVRIETELEKDLPKTLIDAEQLKRVFVNLIDNSYEAFEESAEDKTIRIKSFYDVARGLIVTEVSDNGRGINPKDLQKLFQPYFSTKGRGTGLGLAIVQRIISEHNGKIKVVTNQLQGAKFIIEISAGV
jgi:nitrogen fixation/metabolism regulation signal transduction histidine kinase